MTKRGAVVLGLVLALVISNGYWFARTYQIFCIPCGWVEWNRQLTRDAAMGATALIPVIASGRLQKADILATLKEVNPKWVPVERGDVVYMGGLVLHFAPDGKLIDAQQFHQGCC